MLLGGRWGVKDFHLLKVYQFMQLHHITLLIGVLTKNNLLINSFLIWKNLADIVGDCFAEKVA